MGVFDLIGAAGAGFTKGLATGEQFKFQQKEKEKQQKEAQGYRQQQYALALRKQEFDEKQAGEKQLADYRQIGFKSLMDLHNKRIADPNWWASLSPEDQARYGTHEQEMTQMLTSSAATPQDFVRAFSMVPEKYGMSQGQAQQAPQPVDNTTYRIHSQEPVPQGEPTPIQGYLDQRVPQIDMTYQAPPAGPTPSMVPQMPSLAEYRQGLIDQHHTPDFVAKNTKQYADTLATVAKEGESKAHTSNLLAENPFIPGLKTSEIGNNNAHAALAGEQRRVLGGRLTLDQNKARDFNSHWDKTYNASRNDANRTYALHASLAYTARYAAETRDALAQVEMGLMQMRGTELKQKIDDMQKLDPYFRGLIQALPAIVQTDLYGDKGVSPEVAGVLRQALEAAGSKYAQILGESGGTTDEATPATAPSFLPPTPQGGVPMLPNQQTGTVLPPMTLGVIPHSGPPGLSPELLQSIQNNGVAGNQAIINATPGPRRTGKAKPSTKPSAPPAKKQEARAAPALPRTIAAPNYSNKSEPTVKPDVEALKKRREALMKKAGK